MAVSGTVLVEVTGQEVSPPELGNSRGSWLRAHGLKASVADLGSGQTVWPLILQAAGELTASTPWFVRAWGDHETLCAARTYVRFKQYPQGKEASHHRQQVKVVLDL